MRLPAIFLGAVLLCGTANADVPTVKERGYDECHHAVYGRAEPDIECIGTPLDIPSCGNPTTVPLGKHVGPFRGIKFNPTTHTFTVQHTGTYVIHYFLQMVGGKVTEAPGAFVCMAVSVNDELKGKMILSGDEVLLESECLLYSRGNGVLYENLRKGDKVKLVLYFMCGFECPHLISISDSVSSYLSLHKTETEA